MSKNEKFELKLIQIKSALARFEEAVNSEENDLVVDAAIQRFEFCYELLWKLTKTYLNTEGVPCQSPRETFKKAFEMNLIESQKTWASIIEFRNLTTHTYNEDLAHKVFAELPDYLYLFRALYEALAIQNKDAS
jgi:nucleotidyltransferase substrate binding protein (TIGR01987 family)